MAVKFANLASSTLASSLSNTATSISVTSSSSFPTLGSGDYFYASIGEGSGSEIVKVTGVSSNTFTVVRGQDGTSAQSWSSGSPIALRVVAAALDDIASAADTESVSIAGDTMTGDLVISKSTPMITFKGSDSIWYRLRVNEVNDWLELGHSANKALYLRNTGVAQFNYDVQGDGNLTLTDDSALLRFASTLNWDFQPQTSDASFNISTSSGSSRKFRFQNTGSAAIMVDIHGELQINGTGVITGARALQNITTISSSYLTTSSTKIDAEVPIYASDGHPLAQFFSTTSAGYFGSTNRSNLTLASSNRPRWRDGNGNYADIVIDGLDAQLSTTTISNAAASSSPLIIGGTSNTNYTQFAIKTDVHDSEAYLIAYGGSHTSDAGNFAIKNLESGGDIYFELASSVRPLRLTSTGAEVAGTLVATSSITTNSTAGFVINNIGKLYSSSNNLYLETQTNGTGIVMNSRTGFFTFQNAGINKFQIHSNGSFNFYSGNLTSVGTISSAAITATDKITINKSLSGDNSQLVISNTAGATLRMGITGSGANEAAHIKTNAGEALEFHIGQASDATTPDITFKADGAGIEIQGNTFVDSSRNITAGTISSGNVTGSTIQGTHLRVDTGSPTIRINDTDATNATNQVGYISFQRQASETAWIGYGSSGNDDFSIRNTEGPITLLSNLETTNTITSGDIATSGIDINGAASGDTYFTGGTASQRRMTITTSDVGANYNARHSFKIGSGSGTFVFGNNTTADLLTVGTGGIDVTGQVTATSDFVAADSGGTARGYLFGTSTGLYLRYNASSQLQIQEGGSARVTIATGGNATFVGDIQLNNKLTFGYNSHYFQAGTNSVAFKNSSGTSYAIIKSTGIQTAYDVQAETITIGSPDNHSQMKMTNNTGSHYGFDPEHSRHLVVVNEQGSANQAMYLADTTEGNDYDLWGVSALQTDGPTSGNTTGSESWVNLVNLTGAGNLTASGTIAADGTASNDTPKYTFAGDRNTGLGYIGSDAVGLISGGSRKFYVNATGAFFQNLSSGVTVPSLTSSGEVEAGSLDVNGNATVTGYLNFDGGSQNALIRFNSNGALGYSNNFLYINPNGDFTSGVYINSALKVDTGLIGSYNEDLQLRTGNDTALTLSNTDQTATFAGTISASGNSHIDRITLKASSGSGTGGGRLLDGHYSGDDHLWTLSSDKSSGALTIGYGADSSTSNSQEFTSTFDNFTGKRSAVQFRNERIDFWGTSTTVQTAVGSHLTTMTNRISLHTDNGLIETSGSINSGTITSSGNIVGVGINSTSNYTELGSSSSSNLVFKRNNASYIQADQSGGYFIFITNARSTSYANRALALTTDNNAEFGGDVNTVGNVTVGGNLVVNGTTTTLNTATLNVEDKNIVLNHGSGDTSGSANGAGITIQDAEDASTDASIEWSTAGNNFNVSHSWNTLGYLQHSGFLYSRDDLRVLNSAGTGWHTWADRVNGNFNLSIGSITAAGAATLNGGLEVKGTGNDNTTRAARFQNVDNETILEVRNDKRVLIPGGYLYVNNSEGIYSQGSITARGGISNDGGNALSISSGAAHIAFNSKNFASVGTISSGAITSSGIIQTTAGKVVVDAVNNGSSGTGSFVLELKNLNDTAFTSDALTAYNASTSWDQNDRVSFMASSRPRDASIYTYMSENSGATAVNIDRIVQLGAGNSNVSGMRQWIFYHYDGAGSTANDFKVPVNGSLFEIAYFSSGSVTNVYSFKYDRLEAPSYYVGTQQIVNSARVATFAGVHVNNSSTLSDGTDPDISANTIYGGTKVVTPKLVFLNDNNGDDNFITCNDSNNAFTVNGNQAGAWYEFFGDKDTGHYNGDSSGIVASYFKGNEIELEGQLEAASITTRTANISSSDSYGTLEIGGASGAFIDLKKPASDDYDVRIVVDSSTGGRIQSNGNFDINANGGVTINIDNDNNATNQSFKVRKNNATDLLEINESNELKFSGAIQSNEVHGYNVGHGEIETLFAITDYDSDASLKRKFGYNESNTNFSRVNDSTAPASGIFDVTGNVSVYFGPDEFVPIDDNTEIIFECWAKYISGGDTTGNFYAGGQFYDGSKTSLGNNQRYWGANGDSLDADSGHSGWKHIKGVLKGDKIRASSSTSTAQYVQFLALFNYNASANTTRFCGFRFYVGRRTVTSLYHKIADWNSGYGNDTQFGASWQGGDADDVVEVLDNSRNLKNIKEIHSSGDVDIQIATSTGTAIIRQSGQSFTTASNGLVGLGLRNTGTSSSYNIFEAETGSGAAFQVRNNGDARVLNNLYFTGFNSTLSGNRYLKYRTGNNADFELYSDNNTTPVMQVRGYGTADILQVIDNNVTEFAVKDGGNIGVRIADPNYQFHIMVPSGRSGLAITRGTGTASPMVRFAPDSSKNFMYANGDIVFSTNPVDNTTYSEVMRITDDHKVAIGGISAPSAKLHVLDDQYINFIVQSSGSGYAPASVFLEAGNSTTRGAGVFSYNSVNDKIWYAGTVYNNNTETWNLCFNDSAITLSGGMSAVAQTTHRVLSVTDDKQLNVHSGADVSMDLNGNGQFRVHGNGYVGAIALDGNYMNIYHNSSSRGIRLGTNETARLTITGAGASTFSGALTVQGGTTLEAALELKSTGSNNAVAHADARDSNSGARIHRYNRNVGNSTYYPYYENWYDGDSYHHFGVESNKWRMGNNGLVIAGGNVDPASAKLVVGNGNNAASSAVAQFGGFIRAAQYYILHASEGSTDALFIDYNGDDMDVTAGEGTYSGGLRANSYKIGSSGSTVINSSREGFLTNLTLDSSADAALQINDDMASTPARIHFNMTGTTTVGGGGAVLFETSTSGSSAVYNARVEGIRTDSDNGSSELNFWTTQVSVSTNAVKRMTLSEEGHLKLNDGDYKIGSTTVISSGRAGNLSQLSIGTTGTDQKLMVSDGNQGFEVNPNAGTNEVRLNAYDRTNTVFRVMRLKASSLYYDNGSTIRFKVDGSGNGIFEGNVTAYGDASDIKLKENVEVIPNALDKVKRLDGITFNYKKDGSRSTGLIAQQLQEVLEEAVYETSDAEGDETHLAIRYGNVVGLLVEAMKEQSAQIESLNKRIEELENGNH